MKKILVLLLLISGIASGQGDRLRPVYKLVGVDIKYMPIPGYTKIFSRYEWIAGAFDSGLHVPQYNGVPTDRTGVWSADGAVAVDTSAGYFYYRNGGTWIKVAKFSDLPTTYTFNNGLTESGGTVVLGGTLLSDRTIQMGGNRIYMESASGDWYFLLDPGVGGGRMEYFAQSGSGATYKNASLDLTPDDGFIQTQDGATTYLMGVGVGGGIGTGVYLSVSDPAKHSWVNVIQDSIRIGPFQGIINIDTLRSWTATTIADTAYKKVMTWDIRNGRWEYGNWHGSGSGTPGIDDVLAINQAFTTDRSIPTSAFGLTQTSSNATGTLNIVNTHASGHGIRGTSVGGYGVRGSATTGIAGFFDNTSTTEPLVASSTNSSTNSVQNLLRIEQFSSGTPANGFGSAIVFNTSNASTNRLSNQLTSKWTDATDATRTSQFIIAGVNSGTTGDILTLNGNKSIKANGYGAGTFTGTATKFLAVDADGDIIEEDAPAGGGWGTTGTVATLTGTATLAQATNTFNFSNGAVNFNSGGGDFDVNIQGDADPDLFRTEATNSRVGVGVTAANLAYKFQVKQSTDKNIGIGSQGSEISLEATNDIVNAAIPLGIYGSTVSVSGGGVQAILASSTELAVNNGNADLNFRVAGDTDPNLIVADAGRDEVIIGGTSDAGAFKLQLVGSSYQSGTSNYDATITAGGTTGNQTINKPTGTVNIAAAGTTVTVTNSFCSTSSIVYAVIRTNDSTATIKNVVPGAGSFVINLGAATTAEISIGFIVFN